MGLFETYHNAEEYIAALTKLLQIVVRLDVKKIIAEGNDVAVFFELETKAPARRHDFGGRVAPGHKRKDRPRRVGLRWPALRGHVRRREADLSHARSARRYPNMDPCTH